MYNSSLYNYKKKYGQSCDGAINVEHCIYILNDGNNIRINNRFLNSYKKGVR